MTIGSWKNLLFFLDEYKLNVGGGSFETQKFTLFF